VAETLRVPGALPLHLLDENVRRFNAEVPQIWQWDNHEVVNNWSDSKDLSADARYSEKNVPLLIARSTRAFLEYAPMRPLVCANRSVSTGDTPTDSCSTCS
jgi:alkaline phosphatase D